MNTQQYRLRALTRCGNAASRFKLLLRCYMPDTAWYIAGGAVGSFMREEEPRDIDIFLTEEGKSAIMEIVQMNNGQWTLGRNSLNIEKYSVIFSVFGDPETMLRKFDFRHTQMFYSPHNCNLVASDEAIECAVNRRIVVTEHRQSIGNMDSVIRAIRLSSKRWSLSDEDLMSMYHLALSENSETSWYPGCGEFGAS